MKTAFHILRKDLRRYRWAFLAFAVLALFEFYLHGTFAGMNETSANRTLIFLQPTLSGILFFVLVVLVVQEENLVDPNAYWITKPVHRFGLMCSKVMFVFLAYGAFETFPEVLLLLANGGAERIPWSVLGWSGGLAVWIWQIYLAAQTRSLPRYLLFMVGLLVGIFILAFIFATASRGWFRGDLGVLPDGTPGYLLAVVQTLWWLGSGFGVLSFLYLRKKVAISWLLIPVVVLVAAMLSPGNHGEWEEDAGAQDIRLQAVSKDGIMTTNGVEYWNYSGIIQAPPGKSGVWAQVNHIRIETATSKIYPTAAWGQQKLEALGGGRYRLDLFHVDLKEFDEHPGPYSIQGQVELKYSGDVELKTIPMETGKGFVHQGDRVSLRSISRRDNRLEVQLVAYQPNYAFEPKENDPQNGALGAYAFELLSPDGAERQTFKLNRSFTPFVTRTQGSISLDFLDAFDLDGFQLVIYERVVETTLSSALSQDQFTP